MSLTDRAVKGAQATGKRIYLADGNGLYLRVSASGTKTWFFRHQGKQDTWRKLGRYPTMSLLEARNKAAAAARRLSSRVVAAAWAEYQPTLERHYGDPGQIYRRFEKDVLPELGEKRLDRITRTDCSNVIQKIVDRDSPVAANRTLPDLKRFFQWCRERGYIDENPAEEITRMSAGGKERSKDRALSFKELEQFIPMIGLDGHFGIQTRIALALILLTGQRPGEVRGYNEADRQGVWWHIPITKSSRPQKVYLSPQARHLFRLAVQLMGRRPFATLDRCALSHATRRIKSIARFTPHDLRRTMATRLGDLGVPPHVVEKMLNHKMQGVMAVYNQAEYLPERRAAWRLWGVKLAQLRRQHETARSDRRLHRAGDPGSADRGPNRAPGAVRAGRADPPLLDQVP